MGNVVKTEKRNHMVKLNPVGHGQVSLNIHTFKAGVCSSALVPCNISIALILLGQCLCLSGRLHTRSLSHSLCSGSWGILVSLLKQWGVCFHWLTLADCTSHSSPSNHLCLRTKMEVDVWDCVSQNFNFPSEGQTFPVTTAPWHHC